MIEEWKRKKVAILGVGIEGISTAKFLHKHGVKVLLLDKKTEKEFDPDFIKEARSLGELVLGNHYLNVLAGCDVIFRSPGIHSAFPSLKEAEKNGALIISQTKLFFILCPCPIIGVTGTKGKGTTSSLIYEMLKKDGKDAYLGGNIGKPPLDFLDQLNKDSVAILELSSFQLQDLNKSPHLAVILMVTSEHLNYHKDIYEYVEAKRNILRFQTKNDFAIVNADYPASNESDIFSEGQVLKVSRERELAQGCFIKNGKIVVKIVNHLVSNYFSEIREEEIINIKDILLPGKHNLENVCAAVLAATLLGVNKKSIFLVLKTFKGLEHRLEFVDTVGGVRFYDDSFSTTPETAIAAIEAFPENNKILILGGSSKGSDFSGLGKVIEENSKTIRAIIGIGEEWARIKREFQISNFKFQIVDNCKNMKEIVIKAKNLAEFGDVVLLSPACASFGMFKNYKDRGEQFKKEISNLKFSV